MTVKDLNRFGTRRRVFKGSGFARFSDGIEVKASFTLAQLIDTQLLFIADVRRPIWDFMTNGLELISFTGELRDGRSVSIQGLFIKESKQAPQGNARLIGYSSHWVIGEPNFKEATSISFELVNFRFLGTENEVFVEGDTRRSTLSLMTLNLGEREIKLRWVADYDQVVATLQAECSVQVTCTATTIINDTAEIDTIVSIVDTLCDVMTVARGTLVSWTSFDVNVVGSKLPYSKYRNSVARRFVGIELIGNTERQYTKSFLERSFSRCQEIAPDFQVRRIARAFTETRDGPFIESRSLLIGVLVEYIASVRARMDNRIYFLDNESFESKWETFKTNVTTALAATYPEIAEKHLPAMLKSIKGLNRRPLSWKLNDLAKWLGIKFEPGEVEKFVETRNKLAHEGRFPETGTPIEHYQRMQHFMDRMMLRLFDYHGPYYDFEHKEKRQI
jgi:hypothetical protein